MIQPISTEDIIGLIAEITSTIGGIIYLGSLIAVGLVAILIGLFYVVDFIKRKIR